MRLSLHRVLRAQLVVTLLLSGSVFSHSHGKRRTKSKRPYVRHQLDGDILKSLNPDLKFVHDVIQEYSTNNNKGINIPVMLLEFFEKENKSGHHHNKNTTLTRHLHSKQASRNSVHKKKRSGYHRRSKNGTPYLRSFHSKHYNVENESSHIKLASAHKRHDSVEFASTHKRREGTKLAYTHKRLEAINLPSDPKIYEGIKLAPAFKRPESTKLASTHKIQEGTYLKIPFIKEKILSLDSIGLNERTTSNLDKPKPQKGVLNLGSWLADGKNTDTKKDVTNIVKFHEIDFDKLLEALHRDEELSHHGGKRNSSIHNNHTANTEHFNNQPHKKHHPNAHPNKNQQHFKNQSHKKHYPNVHSNKNQQHFNNQSHKKYHPNVHSTKNQQLYYLNRPSQNSQQQHVKTNRQNHFTTPRHSFDNKNTNLLKSRSTYATHTTHKPLRLSQRSDSFLILFKKNSTGNELVKNGAKGMTRHRIANSSNRSGNTIVNKENNRRTIDIGNTNSRSSVYNETFNFHPPYGRILTSNQNKEENILAKRTNLEDGENHASYYLNGNASNNSWNNNNSNSIHLKRTNLVNAGDNKAVASNSNLGGNNITVNNDNNATEYTETSNASRSNDTFESRKGHLTDSDVKAITSAISDIQNQIMGSDIATNKSASRHSTSNNFLKIANKTTLNKQGNSDIRRSLQPNEAYNTYPKTKRDSVLDPAMLSEPNSLFIPASVDHTSYEELNDVDPQEGISSTHLINDKLFPKVESLDPIEEHTLANLFKNEHLLEKHYVDSDAPAIVKAQRKAKVDSEKSTEEDEKNLKKEIQTDEEKLYQYIEQAVARERKESRMKSIEEKAQTLHLLEVSRRKQIAMGLTPTAPLREIKSNDSKQHKHPNRIQTAHHYNDTIGPNEKVKRKGTENAHLNNVPHDSTSTVEASKKQLVSHTYHVSPSGYLGNNTSLLKGPLPVLENQEQELEGKQSKVEDSALKRIANSTSTNDLLNNSVTSDPKLQVRDEQLTTLPTQSTITQFVDTTTSRPVTTVEVDAPPPQPNSHDQTSSKEAFPISTIVPTTISTTTPTTLAPLSPPPPTPLPPTMLVATTSLPQTSVAPAPWVPLKNVTLFVTNAQNQSTILSGTANDQQNRNVQLTNSSKSLDTAQYSNSKEFTVPKLENDTTKIQEGQPQVQATINTQQKTTSDLTNPSTADSNIKEPAVLLNPRNDTAVKQQKVKGQTPQETPVNLQQKIPNDMSITLRKPQYFQQNLSSPLQNLPTRQHLQKDHNLTTEESHKLLKYQPNDAILVPEKINTKNVNTVHSSYGALFTKILSIHHSMTENAAKKDEGIKLIRKENSTENQNILNTTSGNVTGTKNPFNSSNMLLYTGDNVLATKQKEPVSVENVQPSSYANQTTKRSNYFKYQKGKSDVSVTRGEKKGKEEKEKEKSTRRQQKFSTYVIKKKIGEDEHQRGLVSDNVSTQKKFTNHVTENYIFEPVDTSETVFGPANNIVDSKTHGNAKPRDSFNLEKQRYNDINNIPVKTKKSLELHATETPILNRQSLKLHTPPSSNLITTNTNIDKPITSVPVYRHKIKMVDEPATKRALQRFSSYTLEEMKEEEMTSKKSIKSEKPDNEEHFIVSEYDSKSSIENKTSEIGKNLSLLTPKPTPPSYYHKHATKPLHVDSQQPGSFYPTPHPLIILKKKQSLESTKSRSNNVPADSRSNSAGKKIALISKEKISPIILVNKSAESRSSVNSRSSNDITPTNAVLSYAPAIINQPSIYQVPPFSQYIPTIGADTMYAAPSYDPVAFASTFSSPLLLGNPGIGSITNGNEKSQAKEAKENSPWQGELNMDDMYWTDSPDEIEDTCKKQKATEKVVHVMAFGDSLTRGYYNNGKNHHPYTAKLQYLLNKMDNSRCFVVENEGKDGDLAFGEMPKRMEQVLGNNKKHYNWIIILGGTNDIYNKVHAGKRTADELTQNIIGVHNIAHHYGARTVVVTIPEVFCESSDTCQDMKQKRESVNEHLRSYALEHKTTTLLCDLAQSLVRENLSHGLMAQFFEGGLHLKPRGYETMARLMFESVRRSMD